MAGQNETGTPRRMRARARRGRRGLVVVGLTALVLAVGPGATAQANAGARAQSVVAQATCGSWYPATGEHFTSNHLLSVYLQAQYCNDKGYYYKVAIHNYSSNGVGSRAYGLDYCTISGAPAGTLIRYVGVYIPAGGAWASAPFLAYYKYVAGVIYRPRSSTDDPFVAEVRTGCV